MSECREVATQIVEKHVRFGGEVGLTQAIVDALRQRDQRAARMAREILRACDDLPHWHKVYGIPMKISGGLDAALDA